MKTTSYTKTKMCYIAPVALEVACDCESILCSSESRQSSISEMDYEDITDWN